MAGENLRHPATSEIDYEDEEREFLVAMQEYKHNNRRPFPTWREVLAVARALGYRRIVEEGPMPTFGIQKKRKVSCGGD